uniref:PH domain-containing protein n=1 Tax=Sphingomonas sp. TaxID=28214 RepID=UPI0025DF4CBE
MIAVLLGIAIVEMLVVHLVVALLVGWWAALVAAVLDVSLILWLIGLLRSFRRLPVTIADGVLTVRAGFLRSVTVPVAQIAGLRPTWDRAALKHRATLNLALASWPNVVIDLREPIVLRGGRTITAIA